MTQTTDVRRTPDAHRASRPDGATAPGDVTIDAAARAALDRPVVPLRHPVRWIAAGLVLVVLLNFVETLFTNESWGWPRSGSGCSVRRS